VDLLLSVFDFGSPPFVQLREEIWLSFFAEACHNALPGLIFTFAPEKTVRAEFIPNVLKVFAEAGGEIEFVELICPLAELKTRIENPSRLQYRKLASLSLFDALHAAGTFDSSAMPTPRLTLDTSLCTPAEAALKIAHSLQLVR
jgi:hypothetical protein